MFDDAARDRVARWIAGDITTSEDPGKSIRRWREKFGIKQNTLAQRLEISPSVVSDYESGRRKSPGVGVIRRVVRKLIETDEESGGQVTRAFANRFGAHLPPEIVLAMREFNQPIDGTELVGAVSGESLTDDDLLDRTLFGYTVVDSPRAVLELSSDDFMGLYGMTTERALVFTRVTTGRSPLVAIKVRGITPGAVVIHGTIDKPDRLGVKIAESLKIPLIVSRAPSVDELLSDLRDTSSLNSSNDE